VPDEIITRMKAGLPKTTPGRRQIAVETIHALREMKGVSGVHIMAIGVEEIVPQIVEQAGLSKTAGPGRVDDE